ncbi:hypothetical protein FQR65_LT14029 [Abscondita terminalis]|nr:hypothetical protein FQR65_LT14029 [Abscondita terminalis]
MLECISVHFQILQNKLKVIVKGVDQSYELLKVELKDGVAHHREIIAVLKNVSAIFNKTIGILFGCILIANCIEIFQIKYLRKQDVGVTGIMLECLIVSIHSLMICNAGENVIRQSGLIADAVYEIDFVGTDLRFQKSLTMVMRFAQIPVRIRAWNLVDVSFVTYTSIISKTYSAFVMLKNLNANYD